MMTAAGCNCKSSFVTLRMASDVAKWRDGRTTTEVGEDEYWRWMAGSLLGKTRHRHHFSLRRSIVGGVGYLVGVGRRG